MLEQYLSFDLEIYNELDNEDKDLTKLIPSVAAYCTDMENVNYYWDKPHMTKNTAKLLVKDLISKISDGYILFGWNIVGFDLPIIAYYSEMIDEVRKLAWESVDPMFLILCLRGHYLGLDTVLTGHNLETKLHKVNLSDGTTLHNMDGSLAPKLFRDGEYQAVLDYLMYDCIQPYKLAYSIIDKDGITWTSKSGRKNFARTKLMSVKECLSIPKPDTSWMTNPPNRNTILNWLYT